MDHLKQIAARLGEYKLDAMLCSSVPGERYAVGLHGEGYAIVAPAAARYITDPRYSEVAKDTVKNAEVCVIGQGHSAVDVLNEFIDAHGRPDVMIVDPPRAGMHGDVVDVILRAEPARIVYVSCNPATQARDLALLDCKYGVEAVQPVDMFPHTQHVENVVALVRRDKPQSHSDEL